MTALKIVTAAEELNQQVIEILEEALARAKKGEISEIVVIMTMPSGLWKHQQSGTSNFTRMIGRLEIVKQAMVNDYQMLDPEEV